MIIFENWGHPGTQDTAPLYKIIEFHMGHPVGQLQSNLCNFWKSKNGKLLDFMRFDRLFWSHDNAIFFSIQEKNLFEKACKVQQQNFGQSFSFVCTWRILETLELVSWSNIGIAFQGLTNRLGIQIRLIL